MAVDRGCLMGPLPARIGGSSYVPTEWDEKEVFLATLALPPAERTAFLDQACPDQRSRRRILTLLDHHERSTAGFDPRGTTATASTGVKDRIDEFQIIERIGEGGMGVVYLAIDTVLGRKVALKILSEHLLGSEQAITRFRDEARSAASLQHPAIVPVYKTGFDGARPYIASEFVEGGTLKTLISEEIERRKGHYKTQDRHSWRQRCARIAAVIADALDCSHRAGIVHRDVKPSNILVDRNDYPRLTDFGIAKHLQPGQQATRTDVVGSCHYMSPEQALISGTTVDQRSDIFSLGIVLYEALSLTKPFDGSDFHEILSAVISREPSRLRSSDHEISKDLETICHKALEKDPQRRYQTAAHMAADLRCFLENRPILARPASWGYRSLKWARRHRGAVGMILIAASLSSLGVAVVMSRGRRDLLYTSISIESGQLRCTAYLHRYDPHALAPIAPAKHLGPTPLRRVWLTPGQYRVVVVHDGAFCEFNLVLLEPGAQNARRLHVSADPSTMQVRRDARDLWGFLRTPDDVRTEGTVEINGGKFRLTQKIKEPGQADEVEIRSFLIDPREVSNREYKEFIDATGREPPVSWKELGYSDAIARLPVVMVSMEDAEAYARWQGKRLPTAREWQAAARGHSGRLYPWGDSHTLVEASRTPRISGLASSATKTVYEQYAEGTVPTDQAAAWDAPGQLIHTLSNVRELTGSVQTIDRTTVIMGAAWSDEPLSVSLADLLTTTFDRPGPRLGFRCAKSSAPPIDRKELP